MTEPFLGEIRVMGFNFPPRGWALCDGQILPIAQYQALYSLLGTTYGGDGRTTFALPDLRGRAPLFSGQSTGGAYHGLGQRGGEEVHTLNGQEMPQHSHGLFASPTQADTLLPAGNLLGASAGAAVYDSASNIQPMNAAAVSATGGSQAHENMQPYLVLNFCIALTGIFPSRD